MWLTVNAVAGLLVGVVFLMTNKPDLLGSLITLLIATVLGLALGQLSVGRRPQAHAQVARQS
jgi:F0F1-type ATP synthase assembly protein I